MTDHETHIDRIDPPHWYAGMTEPVVQLMVYGRAIGSAEVTIVSFEEAAEPSSDECPKAFDEIPKASDESLKPSAATSSRGVSHSGGVCIDRVIRTDSPNYLIVYLNLEGVSPGTLTLRFTSSVPAPYDITVVYSIRPREMAGNRRMGFTSADVLYLLMPDRFARASTRSGRLLTRSGRPPGLFPYSIDRTATSLRHGGNLEGIRRHLDYFCELGVTALWLTPVLENNQPDYDGRSTYHGYATTDYYRVDPRLGSNEDYRRLVDEAHSRGLKVVMDLIFNHCGFFHPWVSDRPMRDWLNTPDWLDDYAEASSSGAESPDDVAARSASYLQTSYRLTPVLDPYASEVDRRETTEGWFVPTMPDLNQRNPHLMTYLAQSSMWWIETVGIDGIRMDTYPFADAGAMAGWMKTLRTEYPNINVVGETWVTDPAYTAAWQSRSPVARTDSHLPTVMDFALFDRLNRAKSEETDAWEQGLNRIYNTLVYDYLYADPSSVLAFLDNHDTDRFLGNGHDAVALRQALAILLTIRRTPQLYYGTEILMNGTKWPDDGNVRRDFPGGFPGDRRNAFTSEGRTRAQQDMFRWLIRVLHWRRDNAVIAHGSQTHFVPHDGVYVIARRHEGRTVATVLNGTSRPAVFRVSRYAEIIGRATHARDITTGRTHRLTSDIRLRPRQVLILDY